MSEYIGYEKESPFPIIDGSHPKYAVLTDEEIVRCRDCKYYEEVIRRCHNNPFKDSFRAFPVRNDGYCAWGEKR